MIRFDEVRAWLFDRALPLWADAGLDGPGLGFVERLDLAGRPADPGFKRVRVQARQVYVYSHACLLGWEPGPACATARRGVDFLAAHALLPEGGWARTLAPDGRVLDPTLDLYDQAFVLFALAWWRRASGEAAAEALALRTLDAVEARLARPDGQGFRVADPDPGGQLQNPHMHLLEAALAWVEAGGDARFEALARRLAALFRARLFDTGTGTLGEYFDDGWRRRPGPEGDRLEPGHHLEWSWLLRHAGRLLGLDLAAEAEALRGFARRHGADPATGLVWDEVDAAGAVRLASHRAWPQTEALKAELAHGEFTGEWDRARIAGLTDLLLDRYLATVPAGGWVDCFGCDGRLRSDHMPASTFYHLFLAFAELLRLRPALETQGC